MEIVENTFFAINRLDSWWRWSIIWKFFACFTMNLITMETDGSVGTLRRFFSSPRSLVQLTF